MTPNQADGVYSPAAAPLLNLPAIGNVPLRILPQPGRIRLFSRDLAPVSGLNQGREKGGDTEENSGSAAPAGNVPLIGRPEPSMSIHT